MHISFVISPSPYGAHDHILYILRVRLILVLMILEVEYAYPRRVCTFRRIENESCS
jgi:hypothetical protein